MLAIETLLNKFNSVQFISRAHLVAEADCTAEKMLDRKTDPLYKRGEYTLYNMHMEHKIHVSPFK